MTRDRLSAARYIELIDMLAALQPHTFATKASPTLANQETVSFLFQKTSEKQHKDAFCIEALIVSRSSTTLGGITKSLFKLHLLRFLIISQPSTDHPVYQQLGSGQTF